MDRGRGLRGRAADVDRRDDRRTRSAVAVATPRRRPRLLRPDGAARLYVGVIPIAIGMLWLPFVRRSPAAWLRVLMASTIGLLAFLGDRRHARGARDGTATSPLVFGGAELVLHRRCDRLPGAERARLVPRGARGARANRRRGVLALAIMIAGAIGLHNLGEGFAIGSAYASGALALGAFLAVRLRDPRHDRGPTARSSRRSPTRGRRSGASRRSASSPARRPCSAPGSAPRRSTPRSPRSSSGPARGRRSPRSSSSLRRRCGPTASAACRAARRRFGLLGGLALMFATGLLVSV